MSSVGHRTEGRTLGRGSIRNSEENEFEKWEIIVNQNHKPVRQRFTIAHELAHFFLHKDSKSSFHDKDSAFSDRIKKTRWNIRLIILQPKYLCRKIKF